MSNNYHKLFISAKWIKTARQLLPSLTGGVWGWVFLLVACNSRPTSIPTSFTEVTDSVEIYPDYREVTVPPNIAPMNFMIIDEGATEFVAQIGDVICGATDDGKFDIDSTAWRQLLMSNKGQTVAVDLYAHRANGWVHFPRYHFQVAEEEIDPYVTFRLIEPGYELYQQLGIYQRNLTNFEVTTIYENYRDITGEGSHCINCHNFQNNDAERMYLHVRENNKGTVITQGTEAHKILIRHDSILASGAYGNWHPFLPLVAYSTNLTAQVFHYHYPEKIEVYDGASDLLLYDADRNAVRHIIRTSDHFETFPCWSADGTRLYYCDARLPKFEYTNFEASLVMHYDSLLYDIYSMPFDTTTYTFGEPRLEVNASALGLSASEPRCSPDGRFLLYSLGKYGQFHLYHRDADLWVKEIRPTPDPIPEQSSPTRSLSRKGGEKLRAAIERSEALPLTGERGEGLYPLTSTNSDNSESYCCWSSNSRWIVFSSRREDNDYTRSYIAYIDANGQGHRAFLLPQRDPEYNILLLKSYNVPELTKNPIKITREQMEHIIRHTEAELATYE